MLSASANIPNSCLFKTRNFANTRKWHTIRQPVTNHFRPKIWQHLRPQLVRVIHLVGSDCRLWLRRNRRRKKRRPGVEDKLNAGLQHYLQAMLQVQKLWRAQSRKFLVFSLNYNLFFHSSVASGGGSLEEFEKFSAATSLGSSSNSSPSSLYTNSLNVHPGPSTFSEQLSASQNIIQPPSSSKRRKNCSSSSALNSTQSHQKINQLLLSGLSDN